ncbi:MAG TPA: ABC transporter permease, partial [Leptolyngbyaceae cyanobacterium]
MIFIRRSESKKKYKKAISAEVLAPILVGILVLIIWDVFVRVMQLPAYILPSPLLVLQTLITDWNELFASLLITLQITVIAFIAAAISGLLMAILFTQSKWI